jgi:hypothetical protein
MLLVKQAYYSIDTAERVNITAIRKDELVKFVVNNTGTNSYNVEQ